jgi:hypothetical protein
VCVCVFLYFFTDISSPPYARDVSNKRSTNSLDARLILETCTIHNAEGKTGNAASSL